MCEREASMPRAIIATSFPTPALLAARDRGIYRSLLLHHAHSHDLRSRAYIFAFFTTGETACSLNDGFMRT